MLPALLPPLRLTLIYVFRFFGPHTYKFFSVPCFPLATNNPNSSFKLKPKHVAFSVSIPITSSVTPNTSSSLIEVGPVGSRLLVSALEANLWKEDEGVDLDSEMQNREFSTRSVESLGDEKVLGFVSSYSKQTRTIYSINSIRLRNP